MHRVCDSGVVEFGRHRGRKNPNKINYLYKVAPGSPNLYQTSMVQKWCN
jgi:hypothetical protein